MAYCKKCGTQLKDGARFCQACGEPSGIKGESGDTLIPQGGSVPPRQKMRPHRKSREGLSDEGINGSRRSGKSGREGKRLSGKRRSVALLLVLAVIVALFAGGGIFYFRSPVRTVMSELKESNYDSAVRTYNKKIFGNALYSFLADRSILGYMEKAVEECESGEGSAAEAEAMLEAVSAVYDTELSAYAEEALSALTASEEAREAYEYAEELFAEGEYADALELYSEVSADSAYYESAQTGIDKTREAYIAEVLERAGSPTDELGYQTCIALLEAASGLFPDETRISSRLSELNTEYLAYIKAEAMEAASEAFEESDYQEVFEIINNALAVLGDDSDLDTLLDSAKTAYESSIIDHAEELVSIENYDAALLLLTNAMQILPESTAITEKYETISETRPVRLSELKLSESGGNFELITDQVVTTDTIGNIYSPGNLYKFKGGSGNSRYDGYVKYYLGSQYSSLVFTLAVADESDWKKERILTIYGDNDRILYNSEAMSRTSVPAEVTVDVSGTNWLYIKAAAVSDGVTLLVSDPLLYK